MTGEEIDEFVYEQCLNYKCYPSPLNYNGFPKCFTLSVNNMVIHSIPDQRHLIVGDIVKVDVSVFYKGIIRFKFLIQNFLILSLFLFIA